MGCIGYDFFKTSTNRGHLLFTCDEKKNRIGDIRFIWRIVRQSIDGQTGGHARTMGGCWRGHVG